jgi:chromosome segregation ATPase
VQESVASTTKSVTSKVKSLFYDIDEEQYAQVPEENREGINEAEKVLMEENEKLKLAQLKAEKAGLLEEYCSYEAAVGKKNRDIAQVEVNRLKWEAIERSNIGNKDENLKNIANLKEKKQEFLKGIENVRTEMKVVQSKIDALDREINFLEGRIGG